MERIYYPDYKEKKECMTKIVKDAPEYRGIKIKIWILAVVCPILGFAIVAWLMMSPDYWTMVNEGIGDFYTYVAATLFAICPIFAYGVWNKRFYKCCENIFMSKDKMVELSEDGITFVYHPYESFRTACGAIEDRDKNSMMEIKYPFEVIQKMQYNPKTQVLRLTGSGEMQKYWDYEAKIKDEGKYIKLNEKYTWEFLLYFDECNKLLDYLYKNVKDTVKEPIQVTWNSTVEK